MHLVALESLLVRLKPGIQWASQQVLEVLQLVERQALFSNLESVWGLLLVASQVS